MRAAIAAFGLLAGILVAPAASQAATYYVTTDISNANTQIDASHSSSWTFALGTGVAFDLGGGIFTIKRGPSTVDDIVLKLYSGLTANPLNLLQTVAVSPGSVTQSYSPINFFFSPTAQALGPGPGDYYLELTSTAANAGSTQYFIKAESSTALIFTDGGGGTIDPGAGTVTTPEPAGLALLLAGIAGLGVVRRRAKSEVLAD